MNGFWVFPEYSVLGVGIRASSSLSTSMSISGAVVGGAGAWGSGRLKPAGFDLPWIEATSAASSLDKAGKLVVNWTVTSPEGMGCVGANQGGGPLVEEESTGLLSRCIITVWATARVPGNGLPVIISNQL
jgi:hypothetical protein